MSMSSSSGSSSGSKPGSANAASRDATGTGVGTGAGRTVRTSSRKENVIPRAGGGSSSSVNSGSGSGQAATELFATKDIDRIAKYKADRRKAIYLRNTVQENENERLEIKKRSSSRSTTNTPTSSAIHSKSQSQPSSSKAPTAASSASSLSAAALAARPWLASSAAAASRSAPTSTSNISAVVATSSKSALRSSSSRTTVGAGDGAAGGGGSLPLSPSHQPSSSSRYPQRKPRDRSARPATSTSDEKQVVPAANASTSQQVKQQQQQQPQQPIRTTRSSRLRAAALEKSSAGAASEDTLQSFGQRLKVTSGGGAAKLLSPNSSSSSSSRISPNASTASSSTGSGRDASGSSNAAIRTKPAAKRLVPTIAVNMKQKLKETSETVVTIVKLAAPPADINRNKPQPVGSTEPADVINGNHPVEQSEPEPLAVEEAFLERIPSSATVATNGGSEGTINGQPKPRPMLGSLGAGSSLDSPRALQSPRMRTSTMKSGTPVAARNLVLVDLNGLSPVKSSASSKLTTADKSAKRKSNLNRAQHEEATEKRPSSAERRRRQKSTSAPLSSPEPVKSTRKPTRSTTKSKQPQPAAEQPVEAPPLQPSPLPSSTATTTPASSPYPASSLVAPSPSSTPSTPSKFSTPSPAPSSGSTGRLLLCRRNSPAPVPPPSLQHSSSSSTTLAGEVSVLVPEPSPDSPLLLGHQYSKFSQMMLKSPTLERYEEPREPEPEPEMEEQEAEVPLVEVEQPELCVPLEVEEAELEGAAGNVIVIEDLDLLEAGPSGLGRRDVATDDEEDVARPANRILFDDKFNDEFVVIENSPKSHLIQSLDETDIAVIGEHDDDEDYPPRPASSNSAAAYEKKNLVKMSSVEHFERKSCSPQRKKSLSPIARAKSMEESHLASVSPVPSNHIVSILKRKTAVESGNSSASSNASPVTFSPSVVDTPVRTSSAGARRQGILKKRCSLDESRYSRSHSPDDRSILVKHTRRNSFEELATAQQHGILKQKSYESKEDVSSATTTCAGSSTAVNTVVSHGILKKKTDSSSTSTPNEQPKHVSISQAVILAAAEICQDMLLDHEDHEIRPILKCDSQSYPTPKPILKKKYSSESEEIRPILKSSRKSSREENSDSEELHRSILKTDSPAKRRSFGDRSDSVDSTSAALIRSRSLEHPDPIPTAPVVPQVQNIEKPIISVAERIKNMEKFLAGPSTSAAASPASPGASGGAIPKRSGSGSANARRESFRFKTQPITSSEISGVQQQVEDQQRSADVENPEESYSSLESECLPEQQPIVEPLPRPAAASEEAPLSPTLATTESNSHSGEFNLASLSSDSGIQFGRGTEETSGAEYGLSSSVKTSDSEKSPSRKTIDDDVDLNDLNGEDPEDEHLQIIEESEGQQRLLLSPSSAAAACNRRRAGSGSSSSTSSSCDLSDREMYTATVGLQQQQQDDLDDASGGGLRRSNSVRARANMFQQMESRMKENENPVNAAATRGRRVMPAAQFATQTISPTDINLNHHHHQHSSSNLNKNDISDDSGTEFDPSTLQVSKKIKLFSGGQTDRSRSTNAATGVLTTTPCSAGSGAARMGPVKKKALKFRTVGKLIMPKFLNDNNNNISNSSPTLVAPPDVQDGGQQGGENDPVVDGLGSLKVDKIRRKFMGDSSTPIIGDDHGGSVGGTGDEGSDSNVESGKENNYDSGGEYGAQVNSGGIAALKKNLLNGSRSHNRSILLNSTGGGSELEEVVIKGKVSTMAKQWNKLRSMTLDVSAIKSPSTPALQSPVGNGHTPTIEDRACESLPYDLEGDSFVHSPSILEKSSFQANKSRQRNSPQIDDRFAKYFGLKNSGTATSSPATPPSAPDSDGAKMRRRSRSMPRGNPPAPPPQRPIDERIAKYFGVNKSFSGGNTSPLVNKPRAIVKPQQRLLNPDPIMKHLNLGPNAAQNANKGRRRSRSVPREDYDEEDPLQQEKSAAKGQLARSFCLGDGSATVLKPLKTFEEFNLTAEDLSMADTEFDKLYID